MVIGLTNTRVESLPYETDKSVMKLQNNPLQGDCGDHGNYLRVLAIP